MTKLKASFRRIIVFGPQASGKGTQAEILSRELKIPWISTGEIFRQNINAKTDLGKLAASYINQGNLVPDDITNQLIAQRFKKDDVQEGFILEGYPRNEVQFKALGQLTQVAVALEIWISDQEAILRISGRRVCSRCGMIYHIKFHPPKKEGICDICGGTLVQREDDQEEAIKLRLSIYHKNTEPLLKIYQKMGILVKINGEQPIAQVTQEIFQKLNKREFSKE